MGSTRILNTFQVSTIIQYSFIHSSHRTNNMFYFRSKMEFDSKLEQMEFDSKLEQMESTTMALTSNLPSLKLAQQVPSPAHPGMMTPPLYATISKIPFLWEEKPGKPRTINTTQNVLPRSLDLPPRLLLSEAMMTKIPSPTTVLEGPRSLSFRGEKGQSGHLGGSKRGFRIKGLFDVDQKGLKESVGEHSFVFSSTGDLELEDEGASCTTVKTAKIRKYTKSHFLLDTIYESLKQVIPWRRRKLGKDTN